MVQAQILDLMTRWERGKTVALIKPTFTTTNTDRWNGFLTRIELNMKMEKSNFFSLEVSGPLSRANASKVRRLGFSKSKRRPGYFLGNWPFFKPVCLGTMKGVATERNRLLNVKRCVLWVGFSKLSEHCVSVLPQPPGLPGPVTQCIC